MKKLLSILLAFVLVMSVAACSNTDKKDTKEEQQKTKDAKDATDKKNADNAKDAEDKGKETKADKSIETEVKSVFDVEVTNEMKEAAKNFSVSLVTDTGGIDDRSFNQGTWEGVKKFADLTGAKINYAQSNTDADYLPSLSTFSEDNKDLIIATGFLFHDSIKEISKDFPEQKYLLIDSVVEDAPNVVSAVFAEQEGSFLVGVAAGQAAKEAGKKVVGFLGGGDFDLIHRFEAGYEAGVAAVDPEIEVKIEYVGGFDDAGKAKVLAKKMYDEGAYVIYHAAGGAGNGLLNEAKDRRESGEDIWVIGVDRDQYQDGVYGDEKKSFVLTSMTKRVDVASFMTSMMTLKGQFPGGQTLVFDMKNGGVDIPAENPNMSEEAIKLVNEYKEKIKSDDIKVPTKPKRLEEKK